MKSSITKTLCLLLACLGTAHLFPAGCLATSLSVIEESPGRLRIEASNLENAAAFDLQLYYDTTTFDLSSATAGPLLGKALFAVNNETAGKIHIAAVDADGISGSGTIAFLTGNASGSTRLSSFQAKISDTDGNRLTVQTQLPAGSQIATTVNEAGVDVQATTKRIPIGDPSLPAADGTTAETSASTDETAGVATAIAPAPTSSISKMFDATGGGLTDSQYRLESALDRLSKIIRESRKTGDLLAAFTQSGSEVKQTPELVLTDGVTAMTIDIPKLGEREPHLGAEGARLQKISDIGDQTWRITLLPIQGVSHAELIVLYHATSITIPLTVAPPLNLDVPALENEELLPRLDLDGDNINTVADDYILLANLLYQKNIAVQKRP